MYSNNQHLRVKDLTSCNAKPAKTHTYKTGINAGMTKQIGAQPARIGMFSVSEKTIWQWVKQGKFPKPIKLSTNVTVWRLSEVLAWVEQQAANEVQS